ncbi:MAG: polyamine transporter substrate-binding protein [Hyphomicrobiales bacterium]|nr:polyamine transporter substrate-binding protein [Hyphomicrobiales bacterium]
MKRIATLICAAVLSTSAAAQQKLVNVYNWSDYIDPKLLDEFTRETGVKVVYDTYDSNETLEAKLLAGRSGYDVVAPSGTFLQRQIQAGLYQPLDRSRLANAKQLWPEIDARLAIYDPGNRYAVNYMWFTTGVAYDVAKIRARLGGASIDSWDIVFKPENIRKIADCGVYVLDSPEDVISVALRHLSLDPNTRNQNDVARATAHVQRIKPYVKKFHSSEYINALANGDICMAVGWAGDSFQARNRARDAGNGIEINYVIPKEGTLMSLDNFAIPKDAANLNEAYAFIDFMLRPANAARNTAVTNFANGVAASRPLVPLEILENKSVYPDDAVMKRLFTITSPDRSIQRFVTREWTRIKTGK